MEAKRDVSKTSLFKRMSMYDKFFGEYLLKIEQEKKAKTAEAPKPTDKQ